MHSASTLSFQRSFDAIRREHGQVLDFRDPAALLDALHQKSGSPDQKNLILAALARAARSEGHTGDCALTLMLLALWPGLDAIRRRCIWRKVGTGDEIAADILGRTIEAIRSLDLQRVNRIAATILRNVERDILRAHQREAGRQSLRSETDPDEVAEFGVDGFFFRYEHHFVYWRKLSNGDIGIVTILHERMHQIDRFREDFGLGSGRA